MPNEAADHYRTLETKEVFWFGEKCGKNKFSEPYCNSIGVSLSKWNQKKKKGRKEYGRLKLRLRLNKLRFRSSPKHTQRSLQEGLNKLTEGQQSRHKEGKEAKEKLHTQLQILKWKEQQQFPGPMESAKCKSSKDKKGTLERHKTHPSIR